MDRTAPTNANQAPPAHEQAALSARRRASGIGTQAPTIGLALSGGGIRSATFCLGLLRALARHGVLHRFDYLSTVSGGGYIGSAFGRLFQPGTSPRDVEKGLADDGSLVLWWLRSNGRYLVPAGARDILQTAASQLRGFLATQFEVTTLLVLCSCLLVLPHVLGCWWNFQDLPGLTDTLWWTAMPVPAWLASLLIFAYWWSRDPEDGSVWGDLAIVAGTLAMAIYLLSPLWSGHALPGRGAAVMAVAGITLLTVPLAWLWAHRPGYMPEQNRVRFTRALATALKALGLLALLGAADLFSWFMADQLVPRYLHAPVASGAAAALALVAMARYMLPALQPSGRRADSMTRLPLALIGNACGIVLLALLVLFWLTAVQWFVFVMKFSAMDTWMHWLIGLWPSLAQMPTADTWLRWLTLAVPAVAYTLLTGRNLQQINRSSLHPYYRSRLARTYISLGNGPAQASAPPHRFPISPLAHKRAGDANRVARLTELLPADDVDLLNYAPHRHGGPIHLINCCINQTLDDRTDTYNADRKGVYLTVSALGVETGPSMPQAVPAAEHPLRHTTLAEWVAVSGAAAGSGMGSLTRTGIAALCFLSGIRLGYWWRHRRASAAASEDPGQGKTATKTARSAWTWTALAKSRAGLQEMLARFPGLQSPVWYLSDGGHFDNTGVYSLLKRELGTVVLADCGADPNYVFDDLENLIRKARIDLGATLDFIDPASLPAELDDALRGNFGTPDSIMPGPGHRYLLLARITYASGATGCLLVVKPRLYCDLPLDVAGYADRDPTFPHQNTLDQFFDEAQWESYCRLGEVLGKAIDANLLDRLPLLARDGVVACSSAVIDAEQKTRMTRRQRIGATIGASLSFGALLTVAVSIWQAWEAHSRDVSSSQQAFDAQRRETDTLLTRLKVGGAYDQTTHSALYRLLQGFNASTGTKDRADALQNMAEQLGKSCDPLDPASAIHELCLGDYTSLYAATTAPTPWGKALADYHQVVSVGSAQSTTQLWQHVSLALFAPRQAAIAAASPPASPSVMIPAPPPLASAETPHPTAGARAIQLRPAAVPVVRAGAVRHSATAIMDGAAQTVWTVCSGANQPLPQRLRIYAQIFVESQRPVVRRFRDRIHSVGLATPGIENVTETAARKNRHRPLSWPQPTLLYSGENQQAQACSSALAEWLSQQPDFTGPPVQARALPVNLHGDPNVIELWLPRPVTGPATKP